MIIKWKKNGRKMKIKNIIKSILLSMLILTTNSYAQNLTLIKKNKFTTCEEILEHGAYKGLGNYTLYNENKEPYNKYCEVEVFRFKQENFSSLPSDIYEEMLKTKHNKIKIYHSDDLYYVFEEKLERDSYPIFTKEAIEVVNANNLKIGGRITISSDNLISSVVTSDYRSVACNLINGRYKNPYINCQKGIGDWEIILIY